MHVVLPGVYLASEFPHPPPTRRGELSHVDKGGFWPVSPGGGRDGAVMFLGGKGTFHSSWAREVFVTEPGDHVNLESLFLATQRKKTEVGKRGDKCFQKRENLNNDNTHSPTKSKSNKQKTFKKNPKSN